MKKLVLFLLIISSIFANDAKNFGVFILENPANEKAEFEILTPEETDISVLIYDNMGNVAFSHKGSTKDVSGTNSLKISWNLINRTGKRVSAGAYTVQATARTANGGGIYQYFEQLGVRK